MKLFSRISGALVIAAVFAYLAYTMYNFDHPGVRQFRLVLLVAGFMVSIFGKMAAAVITAITGLAVTFFTFRDKDDEDEDKIVPTRHL